MAWSYSGNPATSGKDEVRFLIGDTDDASQQLSDEEIQYLLTLHAAQSGYPNYRAASAAATTIAAKHASAMRKTVGSLSLDYGQRYNQYLELAKELDEKALSTSGRSFGGPLLGGGGEKFLMSDHDWSGTTELD